MYSGKNSIGTYSSCKRCSLWTLECSLYVGNIGVIQVKFQSFWWGSREIHQLFAHRPDDLWGQILDIRCLWNEFECELRSTKFEGSGADWDRAIGVSGRLEKSLALTRTQESFCT